MADNLETINTILGEIEAHANRLRRETKLNRASPATLMQELSETVMPLLRDFAKHTFDEVLQVRQYLHEEVEPALLEATGGIDDSVLLPEDAALITQRLLAYRAFLEAMIASASDDQKAMATAEQVEVDRALARVGEITLEEDEEEEGDEEDEPDDDEEEEDDEEDDDDESVAATPKQ